MIYRWKDKGAPAGVDAQLAGEELERIRVFNNGRLESRDVVEAARPTDAPLHPAFEWDDAKAAEAWRVRQAGQMINHIEVVIEKPKAAHAATRAFVSVKREGDRSFTSVQHALSDQELRAQVLRQAWDELEAWRRRYAELGELAKVFAALDKAGPPKKPD